VVMKIEIVGLCKISIHETSQDDIFFSAQVFEAGTSRASNSSMGPCGRPHTEVESGQREPKATASVEFVQFTDGTTWGDSELAENILRLRHLAYHEVKLLAQISNTGGSQAFLDELPKPTDLIPIDSMQQLYKEKGDIGPVNRSDPRRV